MEAKDRDGVLDASELDDIVARIDARRAEGASVAAACRDAGISTSTYYRRRRLSERTPVLGALALPSPAPEWPFERETPKAPFYWDQAFADELSDSFVRREFGAGSLRLRASGALSSVAEPPALALRLQRVLRRLSNGPLGAAGPVLAGAALIALFALAAAWAVSMASEPAAWITPATLSNG